MARKRGVRVAARSANGAGSRIVVVLSLALGFAIAGLLPGLAVAGGMGEPDVVAVVAARDEPTPRGAAVTHRPVDAAERSLLHQRLPAIAVPQANRFAAPAARLLVRDMPAALTARP
jgi:hypothetical protein